MKCRFCGAELHRAVCDYCDSRNENFTNIEILKEEIHKEKVKAVQQFRADEIIEALRPSAPVGYMNSYGYNCCCR